MKQTQLNPFLNDLFQSIGGIITDFGDYIEVDLPTEFVEKLNCGNPLRLTLNREFARENTQVHYIAKGTPFFKKILKTYGSNSAVTKGFFPFPATDDKSVADKLNEFIKKQKLGPVEIKNHRQVYIPKLELQYHLNVTTKETESILSKEMFDVLDIKMVDGFPETMPKIKSKKSGKIEEVFLQENVIPVFLKVLKTIESKVKKQVDGYFKSNQEEFEAEKETIDQFYSLIKDELEEKKESLYYHLYFFQKEEKINKMIQDQEEELDLKMRINQLKYRFKAFLDIYNAFIYYFPAIEYTLMVDEKEKKVFYDLYFQRMIIPVTRTDRVAARKKLKKSA